ncbi:MAG: lasso peptide biosynthesis B2 protein [Anaerolineales bacterium]|nr:lasso peptide biosynthesis B2 protein [Anaerolineales bacterium]
MLFKRLTRGWRHTRTIVSALPAAPKRDLLARMIAFSRALPRQFNQPLPQMMAQLTCVTDSDLPGLSSDEIRWLADAVAAWHLHSPLGICLRRSLLRYHFLRQAGLPVRIVFGARLKNDRERGGIGGHAWLTLNGKPFYEDPQNYAGFVEMYAYPVDSEQVDGRR